MTNVSNVEVKMFQNDCAYLWSCYRHAQIIVEETSLQDMDVITRIAGTFFGDIVAMLHEHIPLMVCRFTDPARDNRGNENHSMGFFLEGFRLRFDAATLARLEQLHDEMKTFGDLLRPARNKRISHSDRLAALSGKPLGAAPKSDWEKFFANLEEFVGIFSEKILGESHFVLRDIAGASDVDALIEALRRSTFLHSVIGLGNSAVNEKIMNLLNRDEAA